MTSQIKPIIVCLVIVVMGACRLGEQDQGNTATLTSLSPEPTPVRELVNRSEVNSTLEPPLELRREPVDSVNKEIIKSWRSLLKGTGLKDLERTKLALGEIEIRVWQVPDLYISKTKCWHFSRKAGLWNAAAYVDREFRGEIVRMPLGEPAFGWAEWEAYAERDLSPQSVHEAAKFGTPANDGGIFIVESKFRDVYERQIVDNHRFLGSLYRTIKSEFLNNDASKWREF